MPFLACTHHVTWVQPVENKQHMCMYCKAVVAKKDVYPKWDDLGPDFQRRWDAHEKGEAAPTKVPSTPAANAAQATAPGTATAAATQGSPAAGAPGPATGEQLPHSPK